MTRLRPLIELLRQRGRRSSVLTYFRTLRASFLARAASRRSINGLVGADGFGFALLAFAFCGGMVPAAGFGFASLAFAFCGGILLADGFSFASLAFAFWWRDFAGRWLWLCFARLRVLWRDFAGRWLWLASLAFAFGGGMVPVGSFGFVWFLNEVLGDDF